MAKFFKCKQTIFFLLIMLMFSSIPYYISSSKADTITGTVFPIRSEGDLAFNIDIYRYKLPEARVGLEVCYSLDLSQLSLEAIPRNDFSFTFDLKLINTSGETVHSVAENKRVVMEAQQIGSFQSFIDLVKMDLIPDSLNFIVNLSDPVSGLNGSVDEWIYLSPESEKLSIGGPMFVAQINKAQGKANVFTRHDLEMIPNPARFYDASQDKKTFYIYLEIDNLAIDPDNPSEYSLVCSVQDMAGNIVSSLDHTDLQKVARNTSRIEKISLDNMTTGMYALNIAVTDMLNNQSASEKRYFTVYTGEKAPNVVLPMDEQSVQKYYDQIKYIATKQELDVFKELNPVGKQEFLLSFWKSKDPTPDTPENEFMLRHFQHIEYCEQHFRNGINSDRGRIYIKYGPPLDIERSASTLRYSKPVEIWTYSIQGRVEFVFVDRTNDDNYVLMHSTHPDEYYNPDWIKDFQVN